MSPTVTKKNRPVIKGAGVGNAARKIGVVTGQGIKAHANAQPAKPK